MNNYPLNKIVKKIPTNNFVLTLVTLTMLATCQQAKSSEIQTIIYQQSNQDFPNPERGLFKRFSPCGNEPRPPLKLEELQNLRTQNITLVRRIYLISEFRNRSLSAAFLDKVEQDLATARDAGIKLIIRFAYNWLGGGEDATQERIISHLEQLSPLFQDNYDVIAFMEAGFIGNWGEWNRSSNGLRNNPQARKAIIFKALSVLPKKRMVALRYPYYKRDALESDRPLTPAQAFNGSAQARIGAHNDCFLADIDDWGTYNHTDPAIVNRQKAYLNLDNRFLVQSGELCNPSSYDDCPNALKDLEQMRWSSLNVDHPDGKEVLAGWIEQGCFAEIKKRLGYRLRLLSSVIPQQVNPGETLTIKLELLNEGWASPYNLRLIELVLRHLETGREYHLPVKEDPRRWLPQAKQVIKVEGIVPQNAVSGEYEILLNLPDPEPQLYNRPEYSIRLANENVWEATTGYNSLLTIIVVTSEKTLPIPRLPHSEKRKVISIYEQTNES